MLEKNNRYHRVAPNGDSTIIRISSDEELKYHEGLASSGFTYKVLKVSTPTDSICVSCES